ncbi:hypothetical protein ACFO0N_21340 [Halobium salinum]|uniref:Uncharacterized protein n=1 Tax=Halobium salinum TaxID=1364940 RepID=A0ABD5PJB7_9EURY|nr:hypothetical protein [Halobium salinum]
MDLTGETPPYKHPTRRKLKPLQEKVESLSRIDSHGPPIQDYDDDQEPDDHGDINCMGYISEEAAEIETIAQEVNDELSYGILSMVPRFFYYNLIPSTLR